MGDPKQLRKKYNTPMHPWNKQTIEEEKILVKEYGLGKKKEIQIAQSFLKKYKDITKRLTASQTAQSEVEKKQILAKMQELGLLQAGAELDQILSLTIKNILERRIQSLVCRKGLAKTMKQARQFIIHRHITVNNQEITFPSYLMSLQEESSLGFKQQSKLSDEDHPERINVAKEIKKEKEAITKAGKDKLSESEEEEIIGKEGLSPKSSEEISAEGDEE